MIALKESDNKLTIRKKNLILKDDIIIFKEFIEYGIK